MLPIFKKSICALLALLWVTLLSVPALGAEPRRVLRVAFPQQADLSEIIEDGSFRGYTYDYLEKISQLTDWEIEYLPIDEPTSDASFTKALQMLQTGEADLVGGLRKTPELEALYEYTQNSYGIMYNTIAAKEDNLTLSSSNFLLKEPLRVGIRSRGATTQKELTAFFTKHGANYEFVEYNRYQDIMNALESGEVDVVPDVSIGSVKGSKQLATYSATFFHFITAKGNTALAEELDRAIDLLNQNFPFFQSKLAKAYLSDTFGGFFMTDEEAAYVKEKKTIRVLCTPDCAPFVFLNSEGELRGIAVSVMEDFAAETGLNVEYVLYRRGEDFAAVFRNGSFDCVLGIPINSSYNTKIGVVTSAPYLNTKQVYFFSHKGPNKPISESTIAMLRGTDAADKLACKEVLFYDTIEQCISAVITGKADGGYGNQYCVEYYSQHNFSNLTIVPLVGEVRPMEISISKKENTALLSLVNRYIENMDSDKIYTFHIAANEEHSNNWFRVLIFSDPLKAAILIAAFAVCVFMAIAMFFFAKSSSKKNLQLQLASNAKSDFLSRVSHDMRTPMNAILSFSSMGLDNDTTPEQLVADMRQIQHSGRYLLGLINDVLDMSKMEHQKMELWLEPTSLRELTENILADVTPMMDEKKLHFYVELKNAKTDTTVLCDIMRSKQIFINLLSNAAKFTPEGGTVCFIIETIHTAQHYFVHRFTVRDTGIGMSPAFQKKLFEPFAQERNVQTGQLTGTGLGLAIVKQLVDLMGGTIAVKSEPNAGTEFVIELKTEIAPVPAPTQPDILSPLPAFSDLLNGKHILLCEDHPVNAEIAKRLLAKMGTHTTYAENGQIALEQFERSPVGYFDAILMDIKMPVMDGLSATKAIRLLDRPDAAVVPIIATTANAFHDDIEQSIHSGMNAHLSKPIEPEQLYRTLCEFVVDNCLTNAYNV